MNVHETAMHLMTVESKLLQCTGPITAFSNETESTPLWKL